MATANVSEPFLLSEAGSTRGTAYHMTNKAVRVADTTIVTWLDAVANVCVRSYDHAHDAWSDTVMLDEGCDNHTNPSLSVTPDGHLRIVYGPHGWYNPTADAPWRLGRFCVQETIRPADISEWRELGYVGYGATYASHMTDSAGRDHLVYRGAHSPCGCIYERRLTDSYWDILTKLSFQRVEPGYTFVGGNMMIGPGDVLYATFEYYSTKAEASRGLCVLKSVDGGHTWTGMDDRPAALPLLYDPAFAVPHEISPTLGCMAVDRGGDLLALTTSRGAYPEDTLLSRWHDGQWHTTVLNAFVPDGCVLYQGTLTIDAHGRVLVVASVVDASVTNAPERWGHKSMAIILLVSSDGGQTFTSQPISRSTADAPCWLASISKTGPNHDLRRPLITYTEGNKGEGCAPPDTTKVWAVWVA